MKYYIGKIYTNIIKRKNRFKCTVQFCSKHKQKICLSHYRQFVYSYVQVYNINQWLTIATQYTQTEVNVNPIYYPNFSTNFHCKKKLMNGAYKMFVRPSPSGLIINAALKNNFQYHYSYLRAMPWGKPLVV